MPDGSAAQDAHLSPRHEDFPPHRVHYGLLLLAVVSFDIKKQSGVLRLLPSNSRRSSMALASRSTENQHPPTTRSVIISSRLHHRPGAWYFLLLVGIYKAGPDEADFSTATPT